MDIAQAQYFFPFFWRDCRSRGLLCFLAPQSESETRKRIKEFADDMREKADDYVENIKKGVTSTVEEGKDFYEEKEIRRYCGS